MLAPPRPRRTRACAIKLLDAYRAAEPLDVDVWTLGGHQSGWRKTIQTAAVAVFSNKAPPPKLTDLAPKIEQPLFLIWAANGGNKETMSRKYYELARGQKQIWAMPTAKHVKGIYDQSEEYERRVVGFFDRHLLESRSRP